MTITAYLFLGIDTGEERKHENPSPPKMIGTAIMSDKTPTTTFSRTWLRICEAQGEDYEDASRNLEKQLEGERGAYAWVHRLPKMNWPLPPLRGLFGGGAPGVFGRGRG